jgi:hypothetical protein
VCICPFITLISCSVYFGAGFVGTFLAGRVISFFYVRLRYVECRAGTIYLSVGLEWVAGLYRFFIFGSVVVGTVRLKWWGVVVRLSFHFLQFAVSSLGVRLSVVGLRFFYIDFLLGYILARFAVWYFICC